MTINPAQPNNIDLIESRIFKLPQRGSGISGIEFIVAGADGGTATLVTRFSKGGGGGLVQLKIDMLNPTLNSYSDLYGKPFVVTFGKKGESTYAGQGFYTSGGGGGSTGMQWLRPNYPIDPFLAAGGGSGGFSFTFGSLHGNSAINMAPTNGTSLQHNFFDYWYATGTGNANSMWLVAGGSTGLFSQNMPPICCDNDAKKDAAQSLPYGIFEYQLGGLSASTLQSVIFGQQGGKPTTVFSATNGNSNTTGVGLSFPYTYEVHSLGGRGGAGYSGGGAGVSNTTATDIKYSADGLPTSGAGGTGSSVSAQARAYPNAGDAGYSMWDGVIGTFVSSGSKTQTDNPQSGYFKYRTIADTEAPVSHLTNMTVTLKNGTSPLGYNAAVNVADVFQPYIMQPNGFMDNDGIASVAAYDVYGTPITKFDCSMVGTNIPISITLTDFAGNFSSSLIYVNVVDPFKPMMVSASSTPTANIDVTTGYVMLTAANFPQSYDGCKGYSPNNGVTVNFPARTYYCNDVGSHSVQFHYTDSDGNVSPNYTMTFNVACTATVTPENTNPNTGLPPNDPSSGGDSGDSGSSSGTNERILYVDKSASGTGDGLSWANAFTDLQSALHYEQSVSAILVAAGTYYPTSDTDITQRFVLNQNTKLYGGFPAGGGTFLGRNPEANPTILSGQISSTLNSIYVVIAGDNNVVLDGFTIRDGNANGQPYGGGLGLRVNPYNSGTFNTTVRNCKFTNNHGNYGGAVYVEGIDAVTLKVNFENCQFIGNSAVNDGGAAYLKKNSPITGNAAKFINCIFSQNSAGLQGGAIAYDNFLNSDITNCTFRGNTSQTQGTAIVSRSSLVYIHNSILYGNTSTDNTNLELWASGIAPITVDYSNVQGSGGSTENGAVWSVFGYAYAQDICIDTDPLFSASSLKITPQSPCRNAGKNYYNSEVYDISGKSYRISQDVIDMGAYEIDNIVYVAADAAEGGNGQSWATAFNNLNDGITAAGTGTEQKDIWVKEGTYRPDRAQGSNTVTPNNRDNTFYVNYTLKVYGGFAGTESSTAQRNIGQHPTILSGDIGTLNNASDNTYHVVTILAANARLDGLIIEGGNANDPATESKQNGGGAIQYTAYGGAANSVVANCVFRNNTALDKGGAWFVDGSNKADVDFVQTLFYNNTATRGAALYMTGSHYANEYDLNFYNVTAYGNTSSDSGAGAFEAYQNGSSFPVKLRFYNSLLAGNTPQNYNDVTNPGNITLTNTYAPASATNVFANTSNIAGADGKIMTADDGLQLNVLSPAISFGDNTLLYNNFLDKDIANSSRIVNIIDAGAYESSYIAPFTTDNLGIIYVRPLALGDGTGRNWDNATSDLHNAIQATGVQKVFVAVGNYNVGEHSFIMKNGVEIYGGFDPGNNIKTLNDKRIMPDPGNNTQQSTVLNGQFARPVIWNVFDAATAMNNTAVLDGFMLVNGKYATGAGVRNVYASPTFRNVVISTNRATIAGGGMYNQNSSPVLTNVIINHNGVNEILEPNGGQNILGGGIYNTQNSNPVLTNVTIAENYLRSNDVQMLGAGIFNNNSSPVIKNCIFWDNRKGFDITSAGVDIENVGTVNLTLKNTITQGYNTGNTADQNKINVNPNFVDFGTKNFRLLVNSPAIDAGDNTFFTGLDANSTDVAGNPRVFDFANNRNIDMGAYEYECIPVDYSTATLENQTLTYDGNPHSLTVQNVVSGVAVTYEIADTNNQTTTGNTATNAGVYTITATVTPLVSGVDCEQVVKVATLTINKAESIITADETQNFVYDGNVKNVTATLNHTDAVLVYSPQQGYTDAGVYPITVSVPETTNYLAASENVNLAIENADFTGIALNDGSFTHDGTPKSLAISGTVPADAIVVYNGNEKADVGTYTVNALIQKANYNDLWLTAAMTITDPLPVKLISFTARRQERTALLEWTTATEHNNQGFEIERSADGRNWSKIGFVAGLSEGGSSSANQAYRFIDETPFSGTNYYRLKQLDYDGRYEYSPMKAVLFDIVANIKVWPNPVKDRVTIEVPPNYVGSKVRLFSMLGVEFQQFTIDEPTFPITLERFPVGIYLLHLPDGLVIKLVKE